MLQDCICIKERESSDMRDMNWDTKKKT